MSFFFFAYLINLLLLIGLGIFFLKKYYNLSGMYFFLFSIATGLWFVFYSLTYFSTDNHQYLIFISQSSYYLSLLSLTSFLMFLLYFGKRDAKIIHSSLFYFVVFFVLLFAIYTKTGYVVEGLYFNVEKSDWYEITGSLFPIHIGLSILFLPISIILGFKRCRTLSFIERKRMQYILFGMLIFVSLSFLFLLILPLFGLWAMEKYIPFFFFPFIASVIYAIRKYDFLGIKIILFQILTLLLSILFSFGIFILFENILYNFFSQDFQNYWGISKQFGFLSYILGIIVFLGCHEFLKKNINFPSNSDFFREKLQSITAKIPFITSIDSLHPFLQKEFLNSFSIKYIKIQLDLSKIDSSVKQYFSQSTIYDYVINDIVFLSEKKHKFGKNFSGTLSNHQVYLYFPLRSSENTLLGVLEIGYKSMKDPFYTSELGELKSFSYFLQGHLKYLSVYEKMQELSIGLDKKIDEKTMEYNILLGKQKEFIRYIGHEIKNPLTNCIFLSESILENLGTKNKDILRSIQEESEILGQELGKVSVLVKNIFTSEAFDLDKIKTHKQNINISDFIIGELKIFEKKYPDITFLSRIGDAGTRFIDEIQFRQVIYNLLVNATKFADGNSPKILVEVTNNTQNQVIIKISDNGAGFMSEQYNSFFDKYMTGSGEMIGLGMGLYLCKKIMELHSGCIVAENSDELSGACFTLTL